MYKIIDKNLHENIVGKEILSTFAASKNDTKWSLRLVWSGRQVFILVTRVQIPERLPKQKAQTIGLGFLFCVGTVGLEPTTPAL